MRLPRPCARPGTTVRRLAAPGHAAIAGLLLVGLAACAAVPATTATPETTTPGTAAPTALSGRLTVLAAASLQVAFEDLATDFEDTHPGVDVVASYDGSNALVDQLVGGARADVLATADEQSMQRAVDERVMDPATRVFASNHLVLVVAHGNPKRITGLDASLEGNKLVVCAPVVPCGRATAGVAERLGVGLAPVSEEGRVPDVLGKVVSGEADAGVVYATDAHGATGKVETVPIAGADEHPNRYPLSTVLDSPNPDAARAFVDHVLGPAGQETLATHGFGTPA
ncbi:MAG: molybdate ABC transporter substrate-binding protein [Actinomycetes bacterium]